MGTSIRKGWFGLSTSLSRSATLQSPRIHIEVDLEDRIKYILKDYDYICQDRPGLMTTLNRLERLAGKKKCTEWCKMVEDGKFEELVRNLIVEYYDKCYRIPR